MAVTSAGVALVLSPLAAVISSSTVAGAAHPAAWHAASGASQARTKPAATVPSEEAATAAQATSALQPLFTQNKSRTGRLAQAASTTPLAGPAPAVATPSVTFTVDTTADTLGTTSTTAATDCATGNAGTCSLRRAVEAANGATGTPEVLVPKGIYVLSYGSLDISNGITVVATGGAATVVVFAANSQTWGPSPTSSSVSPPVVWLTNHGSAATDVTYTIDVTTSTSGGLVSGQTITVATPAGTVLPTTASEYSVSGSPDNRNVDVGSVSVTGSTATITLENTGVPEANRLHIEIEGVTNPTAAATDDTLTVATTSDPTPSVSNPYSIVTGSDPVSTVSTTIATHDAGADTSYGVRFKTSDELTGSTGTTVTLIAAPGTTLSTDPSTYTACAGASCSLSPSYFSGATLSKGPGSTTTNEVTLTLATGNTAPAGTFVTIDATGVTNPTVPSVGDTLSVGTSGGATPTLSTPYGIVAATGEFSVIYLGTTAGQNITTIENFTIEGGTGTGGGIVAYSNGLLELDGSLLVDDSGEDGGGLFTDGGTYLTGDAFFNDLAEYGGGLATVAPIYIDTVTADNDVAYEEGGGLWLGSSTTGSGVTATDDGSDSGGGIYTTGGQFFEGSGAPGGSLHLDNVSVTDSGADIGGGIFALSSTDTWTGLTVSDDGAEFGGGMADVSTNTTIDNGSFVTDGSEFSGGGLLGLEENLTATTVAFTTDGSYLGGGAFLGNGHWVNAGAATLTNVTATHDVAVIGGGLNDFPLYLFSLDYTFFDCETPGAEPAGAKAAPSTGNCEPITTVGATLTINGGSISTDEAELGGGLYNSEPAYLTDVAVNSDQAGEGGGIYESYNGEDTYHTLFSGSASLDMTGGSVSDDQTVNLDVCTAEAKCLAAVGAHSAKAQSHAFAGEDCSGDLIVCWTGTGTGGGIFAGYYAGAKLTGVTLTGDTSRTDGGAIAIVWQDTVSLTGSSVTDSTAITGGGIAVFDGGNLTLTATTVDTNTATGTDGGGTGGGILNRRYAPIASAVAMTGGSLSGNKAEGFSGGGIDNDSTASFNGVTIDGNTALIGGGIANWNKATVDGSTVDGNTITGTSRTPLGAGIFTAGTTGPGGTLTVRDSTVAGNSIPNIGFGGGIFDGAQAVLTNDTIEGNEIGTGAGAGVLNADGDNLGLVEVTVADNAVGALTASTTGGAAGIDNFGTADVGYSIIAGNTLGGSSADCYSGTGEKFGSAGYNVVSDSTCDLSGPGDQQNATPKLGPLENNGGPTYTMGIPTTSPAVNVRVSSSCITKTDQRGFGRPTTIQQVRGCDAGAYQLQPQGYWLVAADGGIFTYGTARFDGSVPGSHVTIANAVGMAPGPQGGYWIATATGGVFSYTVPFEGSLPGLHVSVDDIVGIAATPLGTGYWLVGADGGVFAFGTATSLGSLPGLHVSVDDIVGIATTPAGTGYWLVGRDGGVFAFGTAKSLGSLPGLHVSVDNIVGLAAAPLGGYWLVGSDGGVFAFDAPYYTSMGGKHLNAPVMGIAAAPTGHGYWLVAADGGIFAFGSADFLGSMGGLHLNKPEIGMAAAPIS